MIILLVLILLLVAIPLLFMQQKKFGKMPSGQRLERMKQSPNYRDGKFQNRHHTPDLTEGASFFSIMYEFMFRKNKLAIPPGPLPSRKTDLGNLPKEANVLIWFGHSSYFIQLDGKTFLIDPVLSGSASPIYFTTRSFAGSDIYTLDEIPPIDYLILTHDHWDHLDYSTVVGIKDKVGQVITSLGVADHLLSWGYLAETIIERDWNEEIQLANGFMMHTATARHFSGRTFKRCPSLWSSIVLKSPSFRLYIGGDSGYDTHFKELGERFGPFDLALLECGQYNKNWKYIHMMPEETVQASVDLKAKRLMPVHWGKFSLSFHDWNEPIKRAAAESKNKGVTLVAPLIGQAVDLNKQEAIDIPWWENLSDSTSLNLNQGTT